MKQTHLPREVKPLADGSGVLDRLSFLWSRRSNLSQRYSIIIAEHEDMAAIPDAGDRIIELEKQLAETRKHLDAALHELAYGTHTMAQQFNRETP